MTFYLISVFISTTQGFKFLKYPFLCLFVLNLLYLFLFLHLISDKYCSYFLKILPKVLFLKKHFLPRQFSLSHVSQMYINMPKTIFLKLDPFPVVSKILQIQQSLKHSSVPQTYSILETYDSLVSVKFCNWN